MVARTVFSMVLLAGCMESAAPFHCSLTAVESGCDLAQGEVCLADLACAAHDSTCPSGFRYTESAPMAGACTAMTDGGVPQADAADQADVIVVADGGADAGTDTGTDAVTPDTSRPQPDAIDPADVTDTATAPDVMQIVDVPAVDTTPPCMPSCSNQCGTPDGCGGTCPCGEVLYHGWTCPVANCVITSYNTTEPTNQGGVYPFNTGDENSACKEWKLAATVCTTQPVSYGTTLTNQNFTCSISGGFTDALFGTYCMVTNQYVCVECDDSTAPECHAGFCVGGSAITLRNCSDQEEMQL